MSAVALTVALLAGCGSSGEDYATVAKSAGLTEDNAQAVATLLCAGDYWEMSAVMRDVPGWSNRSSEERREISTRLLPLAAEEYCPDKRETIEAQISQALDQ